LSEEDREFQRELVVYYLTAAVPSVAPFDTSRWGPEDERPETLELAVVIPSLTLLAAMGLMSMWTLWLFPWLCP
jgi:hypothetical protein